MKKLTSYALIAALLVSVCAVSACGDDRTNTQQQSSVPESSVVSTVSEPSEEEESKEVVTDIKAEGQDNKLTNDQLAKINSFMDNYKSIPGFNSRAEIIDAKSITKGKNITLIPDDISKSFSSLVSEQFSDGGKMAGFSKINTCKSDGTPGYFEQALEDSIKDSDVVVMFGSINKDGIATKIEMTQANGIRVISAGNLGKEGSDHYVDATVPINYQLCGKLMADWSISKKEGKVNALVINNSDSMLSTSVYTGFAEEFKEYVTSGYCTVISGTDVEVGNGLSSKIRQAIDSDPNLNYVIVLEESMITDAVSAVEQSGKKELGVVATGGSKETLQTAENGKLEMLVAQSYEWTAYAMVDYAIRVMGKLTLPDEEDVPVRVLTQELIKKELKENSYNGMDGYYEICFGSNFIAGYRNLWSL